MVFVQLPLMSQSVTTFLYHCVCCCILLRSLGCCIIMTEEMLYTAVTLQGPAGLPGFRGIKASIFHTLLVRLATFAAVNPLTVTCKPQSNGSLYSNRWLVHWLLMGGLLHLVQRGENWTGPQPAQIPSRCTKCNSPSMNGQCTNSMLFDVAPWCQVNSLGYCILDYCLCTVIELNFCYLLLHFICSTKPTIAFSVFDMSKIKK